MNEISPEGKDIEDRFKDPNDPFQLVFVCAMWLTGFDVPSLSTLYLDKPRKGHTLMQAIARANRVYPNKTCGVIVDYVNVFKYMQQALSDYASSGDEDNMPAKDIDQLMVNLENCIAECEKFLAELGFNLDQMIESETLDRLEILEAAYMRILEKDDTKNRFKVMGNTLMNLYDASKPEIFEKHWYNEKFVAIQYLFDMFCNRVDNEKLNRAKVRMAAILDQSVSSAETKDDQSYVIHQRKVIDLSKLDVDALRKEISSTPYKALEIDDLRLFIEQLLQQLINKNCTRIAFSQRYNIMDAYKKDGSEKEDYYEKLLQLIEDLKKEQARTTDMDLTEEELEIYDLLVKDRKLTKAEEQKVILAAKNLYNKLIAEKDRIMVIDWYKDEQPKQQVISLIKFSLNQDLPESYDKPAFDSKTTLLLNHFIDMAVQGYGWLAA